MPHRIHADHPGPVAVGAPQVQRPAVRGGHIALVLHQQHVRRPLVGDPHRLVARRVMPERAGRDVHRHARGERVALTAGGHIPRVVRQGCGPLHVVADGREGHGHGVLGRVGRCRAGRLTGVRVHDQLGQVLEVVPGVEGVQHALAQCVAVQLGRVGTGPRQRLRVQPGGEVQHPAAHPVGGPGEPDGAVRGGGPGGEVREGVLDADGVVRQPAALHPLRVGVVIAVQHPAVGVLGEHLRVDGAHIRPVGDAPCGQLPLAERPADAVDVPGLVDGADGAQQLTAIAGAGVGDAAAGGDVLRDVPAGGGPGAGGEQRQIAGVQAASGVRGPPHAARVEADDVIGVPHRPRQPLAERGGPLQPRGSGAARDQQQGAPAGLWPLTGDTGYGEGDPLAAGVAVVQRHRERGAFLPGVEPGALAGPPAERGGGRIGQRSRGRVRGRAAEEGCGGGGGEGQRGGSAGRRSHVHKPCRTGFCLPSGQPADLSGG